MPPITHLDLSPTTYQQTNAREGWSPPQLRYATRGPKLRALTQAWQAWRAQGE